jgi:hypothetical protein
MVRKKMEGNEEQRRAKAREAREHGVSPSAAHGTLGASKQRHSSSRKEQHVERIEALHEGKQQDWPPQPRPGSR